MAFHQIEEVVRGAIGLRLMADDGTNTKPAESTPSTPTTV
jgi:hypothetical protein